MNNLKFIIIALLLAMLYSCDSNNNLRRVNYMVNEPVFMPASEFRSNVKVVTPQPIKEKGKMCFYEGYLFISESEKGIHVIDNRNPASPQNLAFIELKGNADISIRNNMLYADAFIDLVWFDISNPAKPELAGRLENAFPEALPICENDYGYEYIAVQDSSKGIVVGWTLKEAYYEYSEDDDLIYEDSNSGNLSGKTGSLSRFTIYKDYLYAIIKNQLQILNISGDTPTLSTEPIHMGWNVETIFSYKDCMYFGTRTGLLIYSVENPLKPEFQSSLQHLYGCDPVVVENDIAYVTVWSGNTCGQSINELFIVDVSDMKHPKQIVSYTMTEPKGVGIDNGTLFVCDDGLKIFDAKDPQKIMSNMLAHHKGMNGFDVIPSNNVLMMIANDGLYQYDYTDLKNIKQLSKLPIGQ